MSESAHAVIAIDDMLSCEFVLMLCLLAYTGAGGHVALPRSNDAPRHHPD